VLFARSLSENEHAAPALAVYLLEPTRFVTAMDRATPDELMTILPPLLGGVYGGERRSWSLLTPSASAGALLKALLDSTNAAWRAAGVYALGRREPQRHVTIFEKARQDPSPWVRASAVRSLTRASNERATLEQRVGPLVGDTDEHVAAIAAMALLEQPVRVAAGLEWQFNYFRFEDLYVAPSEGVVTSEDRPLVTLASQPPFLEPARHWLIATNELRASVFALLLAQHGQFDGLERLVAQRPETPRGPEDRVLLDPLLTGIALSHDAKYTPFLRRVTETMTQPYDLQKIVRALKGMTSADARALRLEVNKGIRQGGGKPMEVD
jgi:hypothetical protein